MQWIIVLAVAAVIFAAIIIAVSLATSKSGAESSENSYFDGNTFQLIGYYILAALINAITLGIAFPWTMCMLQRWECKHTVINGRRLKFNGRGHQLIGKYLLWLFLTLITFGIYSIWLGLGMKKWAVKHTVYADEKTPVKSYFSGGAGGFFGIHILAFLITAFTFGIGKAWADKTVLQWEAKHTHIGGSPLEFNGTGGGLFVKYLLFILLTPLTLGIYALFFPVIYTKWRVKNTLAVYQTAHVQAKAKAHEVTALQDYAKYRIANSDAEIAAVKSGYTGKESKEELTLLIKENNPFAAYHLAKELKGENKLYEGEALELLKTAADSKVHSAQLDLAKQLPSEQKLSLLTEAAKNGNAEASLLLALEHKSAGDLQHAAYWYKVALEWGVENEAEHSAEYERLIKNIALQISENRSEAKPNKAIAIVFAVLGTFLILALLAVLALFMGLRVVPAKESAPNLQIENTSIVESIAASELSGKRFNAIGEDQEEYEYVLNSEVFYDKDEQNLYFIFGKEKGDSGLFLCVGDKWKTSSVGTTDTNNGIFKVKYPYELGSTLEISVREDNGLIYGRLLKFHTLSVMHGTSDESSEWISKMSPTNDAQNEDVLNDNTPSSENGIVGTWEMYDMVTDIFTGEDILYIWRFIFNTDGTCTRIYYGCKAAENGTERFAGQNWARFEGDRGDGSYMLNGSELTIKTQDVNGGGEYVLSYQAELSGDTLDLISRVERPMSFKRAK